MPTRTPKLTFLANALLVIIWRLSWLKRGRGSSEVVATHVSFLHQFWLHFDDLMCIGFWSVS